MPDELPEGLTEEDLDNGIVAIVPPTETVEVEPGNTVTGEVSTTEVSKYDVDDGTIRYYNFTIELDDVPFDLNESWSMNNGHIHQNTSLGTIIQRFVDESLDELEGTTDFEIEEFLEGERVEFEIAEDDQGYNAVANDTDGMPTLRPEGEELDVGVVEYQGEEEPSDDESGSSDDSDEDSSSSDEDSESAVLEIVAENEGEDESTVKKKLAQESGSYVKAYSELVDEGTIVVEDGEVSL